MDIIKVNCTTTKRILCIGALFFILFLNFSVFGLCAENGTVIIGDDPEKTDLRDFDGEWLADNLEDTDWDDLDSGLNEVYNTLYNHWDDEDANDLLYDNTQEEYYNPDNLEKYTEDDFVDIIQLRVENLDEDTATMIVEVNGDAGDADKVWILFVWTDCAGIGADNLIFVGIFVPGDIGGEDMHYYGWEQGNDDGNGTIDFDNHGSNIEMDFDSASWDKVEHCNVRAMMLTTTDDEVDDLDEADMVIDIFPGTEDQMLDWWWILLLILIIIIIAFLVYLYIRSRNKRAQLPNKHPKVKGKRSVFT